MKEELLNSYLSNFLLITRNIIISFTIDLRQSINKIGTMLQFDEGKYLYFSQFISMNSWHRTQRRKARKTSTGIKRNNNATDLNSNRILDEESNQN
jgi:hypothetical protein